MKLISGKRIGFFGAGNMAEALARGLLSGGVPATDIIVSDLSEARRKHFAETLGIRATGDSREVLANGDVLIFAVKPQNIPELIAILSGHDGRRLFISICAGVSTGFIEKGLGEQPRVVRAMPNTPMLVGAGVSAIAKGRSATDEDLAVAREIFETAGKVIVVKERMMDAVTALSGSGPAYFFYLVEAMAEAGVRLGLPEEAAMELARETAFGAGKMLRECPEPPAELRRKVTSPGGTTFAAISRMDEAGMKATIIKALEAAAARSKELGR